MNEQNIKSDKNTVTRKSNLADTVIKYPEAAEVLIDYGLHCVGCFAGSFDTIEDASKIHNMSLEETDEMIKKLNEIIKKGK